MKRAVLRRLLRLLDPMAAAVGAVLAVVAELVHHWLRR